MEGRRHHYPQRTFRWKAATFRVADVFWGPSTTSWNSDLEWLMHHLCDALSTGCFCVAFGALAVPTPESVLFVHSITLKDPEPLLISNTGLFLNVNRYLKSLCR